MKQKSPIFIPHSGLLYNGGRDEGSGRASARPTGRRPMGRLGFAFLASLALSAFPAAGSARAQGGTPPRPVPTPRPTVSPYLNLARPGTPALNYYNLVRP